MSSKFFTNQGTNELVDKININLKTDKNITNLDFLVGYIRMSGLENIIENMEGYTSRILVGLKSDDILYKASNIKDFAKEQIDDLMDKYNLVENIIRLIDEKKLEIYITKERNVHAKMYIFRNDGTTKDHEDNINYQGSLIIGSSNLTYNGLEKSYELNTEIKENNYIVDGVEVFDNLWKDAVPLTADDIDKHIKPFIKKPKPVTKDNITPYQLYIKTLQTYFQDRVEYMEFDAKSMPKEFKPFRYQLDAVQDGIMKLKQYNGFYLADVVGLGKTIVAILIIKRLALKTLVVAPNSVLTQWKKTIKDFNIKNIECISKDMVLKYEKTDNELIVVDEAHNFRNSTIDRYPALETICKHPHQKKVMLLSATPQNNEPNDIANQLYLFQNQNNSTIPNLIKLKEFFDEKNSDYKNIIKNSSNDDKDKLLQISQDIKDSVLKYIMTRRTRTDIENQEMYSVDIESFPKLKDFKPLEYELKDSDLIINYNLTAKYLMTDIKYARFQSLNNLTDSAKEKYKTLHPKISDNIFKENPLAGLMKNQLIKRFESSFHAFKISLVRHTKRLKAFIYKFENESIIYLGDRSNEFLDDDKKNKFRVVGNKVKYDVTLKFGTVIQTRELKGHIFKPSDFQNDFLALLKKDLELFKKLEELWQDELRDPKFELFQEHLKQYKDTKTKLVVFTESQDTGKYLKENLPKELKILYIDSKNRDEHIEIIAQNFDANLDEKEQKNNYDIIITTDTLAEGINLHRSNTIYNYDIPWNATKLMQRIGRINRIGSKEKTYNVFNFKPIAKSEEIIGLSHKAHIKLQSFHSTYGEDEKVYTDAEDVETKELFDIVELQKDESDEELKFLQELRDYRKNHLRNYDMLEKLNNDLSMSIKKSKNSYVYKKGDNIDRFYKLTDTIKELDFVMFATDLKELSTNKKALLHVENLQEVQNSVDEYYKLHTVDKNRKISNSTRTTTKDGQALMHLQRYGEQEIISEELYDKAERLIRDGVYSTFTDEILKSSATTIQEMIEKKTIQKTIIEFTQEELTNILTIIKE